MTKTELEARLVEADELINEYECLLQVLEDKLCAHKVIQPGRKSQVLEILRSAGHISVAAIATRLGISARNVSSQMTYLRRDGIAIATDSIGRKFIEE